MHTIYNFKSLLPTLTPSLTRFKISVRELKELQDKLDSLSDIEAFMLQVISILGESLAMTPHKEHIYTVFRNGSNSSSINTGIVNPAWNRLKELGLIRKHRYKNKLWNVDDLLATPIAKASCNNSHIKEGVIALINSIYLSRWDGISPMLCRAMLLYRDINIRPGYDSFYHNRSVSTIAYETYRLGDLSYADILFNIESTYDIDYNHFIERFISAAKGNNDIDILDNAIVWLHESKLDIIPIEKFISLVWGERLILGEETRIEEFKRSIEQLDINRDNLFPYYMLMGNLDKARELGSAMLSRIQAAEGHKKNALPYIYGTLYALLLFQTGDPKLQKKALTLTRSSLKNYSKIALDDRPLDHIFSDLAERFISFKVDGTPLRVDDLDTSSLNCLLCNIIRYWNGERVDTKSLTPTLTVCNPNDEEREGYDRLEFELRTVGATLPEESPDDSLTRYEELDSLKLPSLARVLSPKENWEELVTLLESGFKEKIKRDTTAESRLIWRVFLETDLYITYIQKRGKKGWNKGKEVKISTLKKSLPEFVTPQDREMLAACRVYRYGDFSVDEDKMYNAMIGHPNIYTIPEMVAMDEPIEIMPEKVELVINETPNGIEIGTTHRISTPTLKMIDQTKFVVITWNETVKKVAQMVEERGRIKDNRYYITIPPQEKKRVASVVSNIGSDIAIEGSFEDPNIKSIKSENKLIIRAIPSDDKIYVTLLIRPVEGSSVTNIPGNGERLKTIFIPESKERVRLERDIDREMQEVSKLTMDIPSLSDMDQGEFFTTIYGERAILEFLTEMKERRSDIDIEWPKGERFRLSNIISSSNISVEVSTAKEWFSLSGSVKVNQDRVLSIRELIQLSEGGTKPFIKIDDNTYIKLKKDLLHRISNLSIADRGKESDSAVQIHRLGADIVSSMVDEAKDSTVDIKWEENQKRVEDLREFTPKLPSNLDATLRSYQIEGYNWLSRLYRWEVGGCLADDMGLGKTIQTIALLLKEAKGGASLVVAPSSVCPNWEKEIRRFAPTLVPQRLSNIGREEIIEEASANSVIIVSYGVIQSNPTLLNSKEWNIAVLDEGHAIKNGSTARSKAAMGINARFRLLTTGTPIQNHLGELWNLFRFINPGFLGSQKDFNSRFVSSSSIEDSTRKQRALNSYIAPFMLRRNKMDVLDDLPEKTEVTLTVDLSEEETNLYEALRQEALEQLENSDEAGGAQHMQILSHITRLRQASCNPKLIDKSSAIKSSKMEALASLVDDLISSNHKMLIFSQFVGHLALVKAMLDAKKIGYQYLDGGCSSKKREEAIDNFQAGDSNIFLISLKAGGTGLNLTAADYVIHLDPWWNPAVEDQASDRAHRIGQTRPVTVYRLVAKGTIEEKIVKLHGSKRDLADRLLANTDRSAKISTDELFNLIYSKTVD